MGDGVGLAVGDGDMVGDGVGVGEWFSVETHSPRFLKLLSKTVGNRCRSSLHAFTKTTPLFVWPASIFLSRLTHEP